VPGTSLRASSQLWPILVGSREPRKSTWTKNAQTVLLKQCTKSRPQRRNADYTLIWFLWTAYLGRDQRDNRTSHNETSGPSRWKPALSELPVTRKATIAALRTRLWPASR
jgi:hypothetical protein